MTACPVGGARRHPARAAAFICSARELADACRRWEGEPAIALDTEFERTRTYYPRPALVQVCVREDAYLIDPLAVDDFEPLAALLVNQRIDKVMHACEADNEVLELLTGVAPRSVFDTQVAAAFTGHGTFFGYRRLVHALLGMDLGKGETRSDWLRRPLSDAQIDYAVQDVAYLLPMHAILREQLARRGREDWMRREVEQQQERRRIEQDPERAYLRIRQSDRAREVHAGALRALAAWREREARARDRPRQRILADDVLLELAVRAPRDAAALRDLPGMPPRTVRRHGQALLAVIESAHTGDDATDEALPAPLTPVQARVARRLRDTVRDRAEELDLPPALLASRGAVEGLVRDAWHDPEPALPPALRGWRAEAVGERLLASLRAAVAEETRVS